MAKSRQAPPAGRRRPDDDDDDDTPRRRGRGDDDDEDEDDGPQKPRKKRASAAGPVRKVLYAIGGVALAIALFVLMYWIYSPIGADPSLLCYFPPETVSLTGYNAEAIGENSKMADVHTAILNVYKRYGDPRFLNSGVSEKDVAKYLSGQAAGNPDEEKDLAEQDRRGGITVIKFKQSVDRTAFIDSIKGRFIARETDTRDGKKYHHVWEKIRVGADQHEEEKDDISFFFPDGRTLVYTTTRRECEEALKRTPGKVVVRDAMRDLANEVDGDFFRANTGWTVLPTNGGGGGSSPFGLGIVGDDIKQQNESGFTATTGSANWFASNGNYFLYAELKMYSDIRSAKSAAASLSVSFEKAQAQIYQSEGGSAGGIEDPFNPKPKAGEQQFSGGGSEKKDIIAALNEYVKYSRVRRRGKAVIIEGQISHGTQEQGVFELFWKAVGNKVVPQPPQQFGGGFGGGFVPPPGR